MKKRYETIDTINKMADLIYGLEYELRHTRAIVVRYNMLHGDKFSPEPMQYDMDKVYFSINGSDATCKVMTEHLGIDTNWDKIVKSLNELNNG